MPTKHSKQFRVSPLVNLLAIFLISSIWAESCSPVNSQEPEIVNSALTSRQAIKDELSNTASWYPVTRSEIQTAFGHWLEQSGADSETIKSVQNLIANETPATKADTRFTAGVLDLVIDAIVIARPDVNQLRDKLRVQRTNTRPPDFSSLLENPDEADFLRDHARLYYGRWLAQNEFYDEALNQFSKIDTTGVLDPSTLLFYRGLIEHQLLRKEECLETIGQLLENSEQLPRRYEVLARLMVADIKPLETDSLDEISRMMNDIRRRTSLFRSGQQVIGEEEKVIEKLDKLIKDLEAQQNQQQTANSTTPRTPMQDSFRAGGKGSGEATSKRLTEGGHWGDLPPAERAAALAEMAKDMPPHYRAVIEEYFRQLAKENE